MLSRLFYECVFFPFILDLKFVGCTSRGHTGERSHKISHPLSFCGARRYFSRKKGSTAPFPRRPGSRILCTNDLIVLHLGIFLKSKYICDPAPGGVLDEGVRGGVSRHGCCVQARDKICDPAPRGMLEGEVLPPPPPPARLLCPSTRQVL